MQPEGDGPEGNGTEEEKEKERERERERDRQRARVVEMGQAAEGRRRKIEKIKGKREEMMVRENRGET